MVSLPAPTFMVNGVAADPDDVVLPVTILHGRSIPTSQPNAPQLTVEWANPATTPALGDEIAWTIGLPSAGDPPVYDDPRVVYDDPRVTYGGQWVTDVPRFVGTVVDVVTEEIHPGPAASRIVAVGRQADLGRRVVLLEQPEETDVDRIAEIADAAGVTITIRGNPGPMLAADTIDRDALSAIYEVCDSSGGMLWQTGDGSLVYGTGDHRAYGFPIAVLPAHAIYDEVQWQTTESDLINRVVVTYGPEESQSQTTITDSQSIAEWGRHEVTVTTGLADEASATQLGALILGRRAWPFWHLSDVVVDSLYTDDEAAIIAAATIGVSDAVFIPIPAFPAEVGQPEEWVIEGWAETWPEPDRMVLQFAVTDRARFALTVLRLWSHAAEHTWREELDRGTWLDALILQPEEAAA